MQCQVRVYCGIRIGLGIRWTLGLNEGIWMNLILLSYSLHPCFMKDVLGSESFILVAWDGEGHNGIHGKVFNLLAG